MAKSDDFSVEKAVEQIKGRKNLQFLAGGGAAAIVGLFLPWYSFEFFGISSSVSPGLDGDGLLIALLLLGALAFGLNVFKRPQSQTRMIALILAGLATLTVIMDWPDSDVNDLVSVGIGYYVSLAGSIVATVGAWKLDKDTTA